MGSRGNLSQLVLSCPGDALLPGEELSFESHCEFFFLFFFRWHNQKQSA